MTIAFALPYRFALERERAGQRWLAAPAMLAAGFVVGTCNEHTGPTLAAFALAVAAIDARRTRTWPRAWMIAGALGVIAGGLALYLAPGQAFRYDGLATQQSIVWRVLDRDPLDYARALISPYVWLGFALPWIAIALAAGAREPMPRARRRALAGLAAASFAILVTLLASPKLGGRLYFAAQLLAIGALVGWLVPRLAPSRARTAAVALSGIVLVLAGWRCVHAYRTVAPESAERVDALEHAVRGGRVELATYSFDPPKPSDAASALAWIVDGRWLVGEDLRIASRRERLEQYYGISIVLR